MPVKNKKDIENKQRLHGSKDYAAASVPALPNGVSADQRIREHTYKMYFEQRQLNRLCPFYFVIDHALRIESVGTSLGKLIALKRGEAFTDHFIVSDADRMPKQITDFHQLCNDTVLVQAQHHPEIILRGQFEYLPGADAFLFAGSPRIHSINEMKNLGLTQADFALHDPITDLLQLIRSQEIAAYDNAELLEAFQKINAEQQRLEQVQVTSASQLSSLIMNLQLGILLENQERKISLINKRFCELFGIDAPVEVLIGADCSKAAEQSKGLFKSPEEFVQRIDDLLHNRELCIGDRLELADGRFYERDFIPIWNNSQYLGHMWVYKDITSEEQFKIAIEKQKAFYEAILNNIPSDIAVFDKDHRYLYANPVAIRDAVTREWIIGKTDEDYLRLKNKPLSIADERRTLFNKAVQSGELTGLEEELNKPDGTKEYIIRNMYPVRNNNNETELVIGYGLNITQRKNIELQLQINEKKYRDLIDFSLALIITHDINGIILTVNPSVCKALELTEPEIIGTDIRTYIIEPYRSAFDELYLEKIKTVGEAGGEFAILSRSGKIIYLVYHNFLLHEPGNPPYVIGFSQDITARVVAEEQLVLAKKQIEQAMAAKDRVLADMSHEIRTPMNGIIGIAGLLEKTNLNDGQREKLRLISESADNLLVIVNDVLDLEKIEAGKFELECIEFNLLEKIRTIIESFRYKTEEKNLGLNLYSTIEPGIFVKGDPYRLSQVLNNLLGNAIKFTDKGAVALYANIIKSDDNGVLIEIQVKDTGIGIEADKIKDVFNPYLQGNTTIARKYGGTGLGLSITRKLIEMQQGTITVQSTEGIGSVFIITLPYEKCAAVQPAERPSIDYSLLSGRRILVAEDNEINQFLIKHILEGWGCMTTIVVNGKLLLEELVKNEYDLILMDIQMPEMNGVEATIAIRGLSNAAKASIPVIALTANAIKGDEIAYKHAGMNDYIAKPFTQENLFETIKRNLDLTAAKKMYDLSHIQDIADGNKDVVQKLVRLFCATTFGILNDLKQALKEKDKKRMSDLAHHIKPAIKTFGIADLYDTIALLNNGNTNNMSLKLFKENIILLDQTLTVCIEQLKKDFTLDV